MPYDTSFGPSSRIFKHPWLLCSGDGQVLTNFGKYSQGARIERSSYRNVTQRNREPPRARAKSRKRIFCKLALASQDRREDGTRREAQQAPELASGADEASVAAIFQDIEGAPANCLVPEGRQRESSFRQHDARGRGQRLRHHSIFVYPLVQGKGSCSVLSPTRTF